MHYAGGKSIDPQIQGHDPPVDYANAYS